MDLLMLLLGNQVRQQHPCYLGQLSDRVVYVVAANVTIMGVQYPLFTHAHHGYGLNDAFDHSVALLVNSSGVAPTPETLGHGQGREQAVQQHTIKHHAADQVFTPHNPDVMRNVQPSRVDRVGSYEAPSNHGTRGLRHKAQPRLLNTEEQGSVQSRQLQATSEAFSASQGEVHKGVASASFYAAGDLSPPEHAEASKAVPALDLIRGSAMVAERQLRTELPVVAHPCLHNGYSRPYRRMIADGELPKPAIVQLVGR